MAILLFNESICPLCNAVLYENQKIMGFPPLISNIKDPLFIFSDACVHVDCLNKNELKNKVLQYFNLYNEHWFNSEKRCFIDKQIIHNHQDIIFFGLLTSVEAEDLHEFNFLVFNRKNISKWKDLNRFFDTGQKFILEEKWEGFRGYNRLENLIAEIKVSC